MGVHWFFVLSEFYLELLVALDATGANLDTSSSDSLW